MVISDKEIIRSTIQLNPTAESLPALDLLYPVLLAD
jgi:hypothetical protein